MAHILSFNASRKKSKTQTISDRTDCEHKQVTASTVYRTVRCSICGTELDPFDVLVDMLKAYIPADTGDEELRLQREMERRLAVKEGREPTSTR